MDEPTSGIDLQRIDDARSYNRFESKQISDLFSEFEFHGRGKICSHIVVTAREELLESDL